MRWPRSLRHPSLTGAAPSDSIAHNEDRDHQLPYGFRFSRVPAAPIKLRGDNSNTRERERRRFPHRSFPVLPISCPSRSSCERSREVFVCDVNGVVFVIEAGRMDGRHYSQKPFEGHFKAGKFALMKDPCVVIEPLVGNRHWRPWSHSDRCECRCTELARTLGDPGCGKMGL